MEMKVAPGKSSRMKIVLNGMMLLALSLSGIQEVQAQTGQPIPLEQRPMTVLQMLETQYVYVPQLLVKQGTAAGEAQNALSRVAGNQERRYERGAEIGEIVQNVLHDFQVILSDFFDCLDFKIVGLCYKITWTGIKFDIYRQYRLPVQDVESVENPFESGFLPKFVNEALLPITEATYYPMATTAYETSAMWTSQSIDMAGSLAGFDFNVSNQNFQGDENAQDQIKQINEDRRFHGGSNPDGGSRNVEYTVLPQLFNQTVGRLWFFCHDVLFPGIWSSYYPLTILPARMSALSFLLFPAEMLNKFIVPHSCAGVNNQLRGGHTPFDMILTGNTTYDAMNIVSPGLGCLKENDGNWVPVLNTSTDAAFSVGSVKTVMKGIKTANRLMPMSFYDYTPERDRVQWSANDRMPDNCQRLEKFVRDFGDANLRKGDDPRNVAIHWRFFRCCKRGFKVLFGPKPIIRR